MTGRDIAAAFAAALAFMALLVAATALALTPAPQSRLSCLQVERILKGIAGENGRPLSYIHCEWVKPTLGGWSAQIVLPGQGLGAGHRWRFSFTYDPVIVTDSHELAR